MRWIHVRHLGFDGLDVRVIMRLDVRARSGSLLEELDETGRRLLSAADVLQLLAVLRRAAAGLQTMCQHAR